MMDETTVDTEDGFVYAFGRSSQLIPIILDTPDKPQSGPKTVIVIGMMRGGTSATAAAIDGLGICMSEDNAMRRDGHFETRLFKEDVLNQGIWENIQARMRHMNEKYDFWGFQAWINASHLARYREELRNPHLVVVFRDLVALVQAHLHTQELGNTIDDLLVTIPAMTGLLLHTAQEARMPTLLVSFEKLKTLPEQFIYAVSEFLQITPTPRQWLETLARINSRGGYLRPPLAK